MNAPFSSATAEARLTTHLKNMGVHDGETLHGFRSGCAIALALKGADLAEIMDHVGWNRRHTALSYLQHAKVLNPAGASERLASSDITDKTNPWQNTNTPFKNALYALSTQRTQTKEDRTHQKIKIWVRAGDVIILV